LFGFYQYVASVTVASVCIPLWLLFLGSSASIAFTLLLAQFGVVLSVKLKKATSRSDWDQLLAYTALLMVIYGLFLTVSLCAEAWT